MYTYKPALLGQPRYFELTDAGLTFRAGRRRSVWRYADIAKVQLSYRPMSMQQHRFRADIVHRSGTEIAVISASWTSIVMIAAQNDGYRKFLVELHRRLMQSDSEVVFTTGLNRSIYTLAVIALSLVALALLGLLIRALATASFAAALFLVGFAALFAWQVGGWLQRNRPGTYDPANLPKALLP